MEHKRIIHREGPALIDVLLRGEKKKAAGGPVPPAAGFGTGGPVRDGAAKLAKGETIGHNRSTGAARLAIGESIGMTKRDGAARLARGETVKAARYTPEQIRVWQRRLSD